jgi:hydantoinase/carbamoylase family amidase
MSRAAELATCTERPGELTRTFCSPAMHSAQQMVGDWFTAAGLQCRLDAATNLIGRFAAAQPAHVRPRTLIIGSHLDTVVNAGRYDGALGVLMGLALVELMAETGLDLPFAIEVIGFCEEEGVRYQTPYIGSRALVGDLTAELLARPDEAGVAMNEALRGFGGSPDRLAEAVLDPASVVAYIEPHIEQGPVLERLELPLGVVRGIAGQTRARFVLTGTAGHAGTVPMDGRRDALAAAAQLVLEVERIGRSQPGLVATVGHLLVAPNAANVIPGRVTLRLDLRHLDDPIRRAAFQEIQERAAAVAAQRSIECRLDWSEDQPAVACDPALVAAIGQCVADAGWQSHEMASGAGHDAVILARRVPVAMLFLRCKGGISHHPDESVTTEDVAAGLDVLVRLVGRLAAAEASS